MHQYAELMDYKNAQAKAVHFLRERVCRQKSANAINLKVVLYRLCFLVAQI